jgi:hypothetical protein
MTRAHSALQEGISDYGYLGELLLTRNDIR